MGLLEPWAGSAQSISQVTARRPCIASLKLGERICAPSSDSCWPCWAPLAPLEFGLMAIQGSHIL